ncbi:MAG: ribonuclease catalytic domain-containing protein [Stenomitos frigidus ULC029]
MDCDDALWVEAEGANTRLEVHIADVTSQIKQGEYLDQQALQRGETRYLPQVVKPLFPQSLEGSMSLLPFEERPVVTVSILLDPAGEVLAVQCCTQTLVSQAKLDYESVTGILRGAPHHLSPQLKQLERVTQALSRQRQQQGAVYGQLLGGVYVDEDGRHITKTVKAQQMIAETMILTNRVVSEYMYSRALPWVYRTHGYRDLSALPAERQAFIRSLQAIEDETNLRKTLASYYDRAQYQVTPSRHEGLALAVYTHFTSPIRRYVDVINHRLLKAAIAGESMPYTTEQLEAIAAQLTAQQRVIKEKWQERLRIQAHSKRTALLEPTQLPQVGNLAPSEFSKLLKTAVKQGQLETLQPHILQRLEADTLQPLDFYQVFVVVPTTAMNITFKFQLLAAIADKPLVLQVVNLLIDNWKPDTKVEYREQGEMNAWAALCVVSSEGTEQCPPQWSVARSKSVARLQSAQQWLQSWLYEELTTPDQAQSPNDTIESFQDGAVETLPIATPVLQPVSVAVEDKTDYVTQLNLYAQQHAQPPTTYDFEGSGTAWQCRCYFLELIGSGQGTNKKLAKSAAAKDLWEQL